MRLRSHFSLKARFLLAALISSMFITACGSSSGSSTSSSFPLLDTAFLFPGEQTSLTSPVTPTPEARVMIQTLLMDGSDKGYFVVDTPHPHVPKPDEITWYYGTAIDASDQEGQANEAVSLGYHTLVVDPVDPEAETAIVTQAHNAGVRVIALDNLIPNASLDYYVGFDKMAIGQAQGSYIATNFATYVSAGHNNILFFNGPQSDPAAALITQGVHSSVDPVIQAGKLTNLGDLYTADPSIAQSQMEAKLTKYSNNIQIVYTSADSIAAGVIAALQAEHLNGKVLVTGNTASVGGIHQILANNQSMTVYQRPQAAEKAVVQLLTALSQNGNASGIALQITLNNGTQTPSVLLPSIVVDKTNIASTVLQDGFVQKNDVCQGLPVGTDGIC